MGSLIRHSYHQFDLKMRAVFFTGFFVFAIIGSVNSQLSLGAINERLNEIAATRWVRDISNEALECIWNDWEERDIEAKKHGTYDFCRFSEDAYGLFGKNGKWFCFYTRAGCTGSGYQLDSFK